MNVRVRLFATLRQAAGWAERSYSLDDGATVGDVLARLAVEAPALGLGSRTVYAAVNQEYAQPEQPLSEGDVLALFPPVSGGR